MLFVLMFSLLFLVTCICKHQKKFEEAANVFSVVFASCLDAYVLSPINKF